MTEILLEYTEPANKYAFQWLGQCVVTRQEEYILIKCIILFLKNDHFNKIPFLDTTHARF